MLITSGVPQGKIMGLLLFIIYNIHTTKTIPENNFFVFANDTTAVIKHSNCKSLGTYTFIKLNCLPSLLSKHTQDEYRQNKLRLHSSSSKNKLRAHSLLIDWARNFKIIEVLGLGKNDGLGWNEHSGACELRSNSILIWQ